MTTSDSDTLARLVAYHDHIEAPHVQVADDVRRGRRRVRRNRGLAAGGVALGMASVVLVATLVTGGGSTDEPAPADPSRTDPSPTEAAPIDPDQAEERFPALSAQDIRDHPDANVIRRGFGVVGAAGVAARMWEVCLDVCRPGDDSTWYDGTLQWALEVTRDEFRSSSLYEVSTMSVVSHAADDQFVVHGSDDTLVDSTGSRHVLTEGATLPVTDIAGPIVATGRPYSWVDLETGELHAIENTDGIWEWEKAGDTWYWGSVYVTTGSGQITDRGLTWRKPDGTFGVRLLPIEFDEYSTQMLRAGVPGTMAAVDPGPPGLLHVSTDYGASWQVRTIPSDVPRYSNGAVVGPALPDDWETWPIL